MHFLRHNLRLMAAVLLVAGCGSTGPTAVGIDLVDRSGGEVVEVADIRSSHTASRFREVFPSVLGSAEELLIGRMNGIDYVSLLKVSLLPTDFPGGSAAALTVDSVFVELRVLGNLNRGTLGQVLVSVPDDVWSETQTFVDTTDFETTLLSRTALLEVTPTQTDSTIRIPLPAHLLTDAIAADLNLPTLEFALSGATGAEDYLIVVGSREATESGKTPQLVAQFVDAAPARADIVLDTYFADRISPPGPGEILLQTGVFSAGVIRFDLPSIPESATVNLVELTMDFDTDRSFLASLRLRVERLNVSGADTTFSVSSGNALNEQIVSPASSPFVMNLDQLLFHGWMSGSSENRGLIINPVFDITPDLRYEWGLFTNPRIRVVYSLPPPIGTTL